MTAEEALAWCADELKARDRDRWLATLWAPAAARPGLVALFALDLALWEVVATTTDARIGQIRLAWWRERLDALGDAPPPAQPVLVALGAHALPRGLDGAALAALEDSPLFALAGDWPQAAALRGERLFALAARLAGHAPVAGLGRAWAVGEAARRGVRLPPAPPPPPPARVARGLGALVGLDRLGRRDAARLAAGQAPERRAALARQLVLARAALGA